LLLWSCTDLSVVNRAGGRSFLNRVTQPAF